MTSEDCYWVACVSGAACRARTPDHARGGYNPACGPARAHGDAAVEAARDAGFGAHDRSAGKTWRCAACGVT